MKKLSLKNIRLSPGAIRASILIAFSLVIIILTSVYFVQASKVSAVVPDPDETPYLYTPLPRTASISPNPAVGLENIIDGEKRTTIRMTLPSARSYIFGETLAAERDFKRESSNQLIYMARMTANGTMQTVTSFGDSGHNTFVSAKNTGQGYVVFANSDTANGDCALYRLDYEGRLLNTVSLGTPRSERGVDLYIHNYETIVAVMEVTDLQTGRTELYVKMFDTGLKEVYTPKRFNPVASLEYKTIFRSTGYMIFATASEGKSVYPILIKFNEETAAEDAVIVKFDKTLPYTRLTDVIPSATGGFLFGAITENEDDKAKLIHYRNDIINVVYEGATDAVNAKIIDADQYYFRVECRADDMTMHNVAAISRELTLTAGNVTKLSGLKKLINVIKDKNENYYALTDNLGKTEIIGVNGSSLLKIDAAPIGMRIENSNLIMYGTKDNKPYISFSDYLFPSTPS